MSDPAATSSKATLPNRSWGHLVRRLRQSDRPHSLEEMQNKQLALSKYDQSGALPEYLTLLSKRIELRKKYGKSESEEEALVAAFLKQLDDAAVSAKEQKAKEVDERRKAGEAVREAKRKAQEEESKRKQEEKERKRQEKAMAEQKRQAREAARKAKERHAIEAEAARRERIELAKTAFAAKKKQFRHFGKDPERSGKGGSSNSTT